MRSLPCDPGTGLFVGSIWMAMLVLAVVYVLRFGADVPLWDDYAVVPQLAGTEPVTIGWLWSQHSEHRIPLARLILLGAFRSSGADPRPVMLLIVGLLGALAVGLLLAVRRVRGSWHAADAFLPLVLLNLGQHENFLWSIQITYVLAVVLLGVVLAVVVRSREVPGLGSLALASLCMSLMPLCNAGGLAFLPALLLWLWLLAAGVLVRHGAAGRRRALAIAAFSLPPLVLMGLYLHGYSAPAHHAAPGDATAVARTTLQFLAMSLGEPGARLWPASGLLVLALLLSATALLAWVWIRQPASAARIEGLAWVLAAVVSLALGSGWGRSGEGVLAGLQPRYTTLAAPALLVSYFALSCYGWRASRTFCPLILFFLGCVLLWPNIETAWTTGDAAHRKALAVDRDLASGVPLFRLVRRHTPFLHPSQEILHESLSLLQRAGIGRFRSIQDDPPFGEQPVPLQPVEVRLARWNEGRIEVTGLDPWIRFNLAAPLYVCGVRMRYAHAAANGAPAHFRMAWRGPTLADLPIEPQYGNWNLPTGPDQTTTIWIDDWISQIRIQPDNHPCTFELRTLTLLLPTAQFSDETRK